MVGLGNQRFGGADGISAFIALHRDTDVRLCEIVGKIEGKIIRLTGCNVDSRIEILCRLKIKTKHFLKAGKQGRVIIDRAQDLGLIVVIPLGSSGGKGVVGTVLV